MTSEYLNGVQEFTIGNEKLLCDKSVVPRPILPPDYRFPAFSQFRDICHPEWKVTKRMILARFTWPKAGQNIKVWCKEFLQCQRNKISRNTKPMTCQNNDGIARFSHINLDTVGPLSAVPDSHKYLVTFTDKMTIWVEAQPVSSTPAVFISDAFLNSWFSRFGVPLYITTDRGSQFDSELFECLAKTIGFCRLRTTAYHPQSYGLIKIS